MSGNMQSCICSYHRKALKTGLIAPDGNEMNALSVVAVCASLALAACGTGNQIRVGSDGRPLPQVYRISGAQEDKIPFRLLDSVNALRAAKGAGLHGRKGGNAEEADGRFDAEWAGEVHTWCITDGDEPPAAEEAAGRRPS